MTVLIRKLNQMPVVYTILAVLLGLVVGAILMLFGGFNPIVAYWGLLTGAFGGLYSIGETLRATTPLILTGLSVALAFRTGIFNIGGNGQFLVGQLAGVIVGFSLHLPMIIELPLCLIAAALAGGLWASIAGALKALRGVHEVITTIMLNWIALFLVNYLIQGPFQGDGQRTKQIAATASMQVKWLSHLFGGSRVNLGLFLALLCAVGVWFLLWKTRRGFEFRAVGLNPEASRYAGMHVKTNMVLCMALSGALAGLAGATEGLGVYGYMNVYTAAPDIGFNGIAVALIGANGAFGTILGALLFGILTFGAQNMEMLANVPYEIVSVVIALVLFFVAANGIIRDLFSGFGLFARFGRRHKESSSDTMT